MKAIIIALCIASSAILSAGCEIADPIIIAVGLPLEVSADLNGGNSWNEGDTFTIEDEIAEVDVEYVDDVTASRVNDITIHMVNPPASGTSSGVLSYSSPTINSGAGWAWRKTNCGSRRTIIATSTRAAACGPGTPCSSAWFR